MKALWPPRRGAPMLAVSTLRHVAAVAGLEANEGTEGMKSRAAVIVLAAGRGTRFGGEGHKLWPELVTEANDLFVAKNRFSAFLPSACDLPGQLRERGIDTVLIVGTLTNVCSESSARDAAMQDFKTIMVSDGNATRSDEDHLATLRTFIAVFGDVRSTDETIAMLRAGSPKMMSAAE